MRPNRDWRLALLDRRRALRCLVALLGVFGAAASFFASATRADARVLRNRKWMTMMTAHDFSFPAIEGGEIKLAAWTGRPLLVVNTASFCGFTPQYRDLEALWRRYKNRGLVVLGVPSNDFGAQEPGTATEIKKFCEIFDVSFPLADKQRVIGTDAHPFYRWIVAELGEDAAPRWNFHKYLIAPDGMLAGAWPSRVKPDTREIVDEIEFFLPRAS
jgi:glutathione peroxidase